MNVLKNKYDNLYLFLKNKYYREFLRLLFTYKNLPRNKIQKVRFLNYHIEIQDPHSFIFQFKEIFVKQYYLFKSISKKPLIFDCGANIGISCFFFKQFFPNAKVIAFEADNAIASLLKNNLKNNLINDIEVISKAVWINNNGIYFGAEGADTGSIYSETNKIWVESIRLKDLLNEEIKVDFLKIDIEGAETEVIEDCDGNLSNVENIFIEYHSFIDKKQSLHKILKILTANKFRYFIKSDEARMAPFLNRKSSTNSSMDLQLNIFAYKNNFL